MPSKVILLVGTRRGLYVARSDARRRSWKLSGPHLATEPVGCAVLDSAGTILAGVRSARWGPSIHRSRDLGRTWEPAAKQPRFGEGAAERVDAVWHIAADHPSRPGSFYAGVAPAALFQSEDGGATWTELAGLRDHDTRPQWKPGRGGLCLHTILVDPADASRLYAGISAVGAFESGDRGQSWILINDGLPSVHHPGEVGAPESCVHKMALAAGEGAPRLYQQNHIGVWRRDGGAGPWTRIDTAGLPSEFGFPIVAHPADRDTAYVIPLESAAARQPKEGKLAVWRTTDAGRAWRALRTGLPSGAQVGVLRDAFATDGLSRGPGLYFGTTGGHLFASADGGARWKLLEDYLPPIYSVAAFGI